MSHALSQSDGTAVAAEVGDAVRVLDNKQTLLSVLMPVYNEEELIAASINRVLAAPLPNGMDLEIVAVDDGSTDRSALLLEQLAREHPEIVPVRHPVNRGKGAAIRTAIQRAR